MRPRLTLPVIAGLAVITALIVIVVTLRSSPSVPTDEATAVNSPPAATQSKTPSTSRRVPGSTDQPRVSRAAGKDLQEAQGALAEKKYDDALAALARVKANPGKNEYDVFLMNRFYVTAYVGLHNYQDAVPVLEASLNSEFLKPDERKKQVVAAAYLNYQVHDYNKAIEFGERAIGQDTKDSHLSTMVAQAYYLKGDWTGAQRFEEILVGDQVAAGTIPDKASLELWSSACIKLRDTSCEVRPVSMLNAYYPSAESRRLQEQLRTAR